MSYATSANIKAALRYQTANLELGETANGLDPTEDVLYPLRMHWLIQ
jgi:hypothetical protein